MNESIKSGDPPFLNSDCPVGTYMSGGQRSCCLSLEVDVIFGRFISEKNDKGKVFHLIYWTDKKGDAGARG